MECHLHVGLPVHGELEPALLVQRRGGRRCASTEHEDVRLQHVEHCGRRAGLCRIERQSLDATNIHGELSKPGLMPRYCKYARAVSHAAPDDLSSDAAAPADHDHGFALQWKQLPLRIPKPATYPLASDTDEH